MLYNYITTRQWCPDNHPTVYRSSKMHDSLASHPDNRPPQYPAVLERKYQGSECLNSRPTLPDIEALISGKRLQPCSVSAIVPSWQSADQGSKLGDSTEKKSFCYQYWKTVRRIWKHGPWLSCSVRSNNLTHI